SMGDKVTEEAFKICDNKYLTKEYLKKNNVPTPEGKMFDENAVDEEIIQYAMKIGFPLVIKPTNANGGRGVFSNLTNTEDLINAVNHVRNEVGYKEIIVEQYVPGDRKSTRLNSSHVSISYAVFCLKKKKKKSIQFFRNFYN